MPCVYWKTAPQTQPTRAPFVNTGIPTFILNGVDDSLSKVAQVVYIKTTEPADMQKFEDYGIRGLPSLVIADMNGRELSRFSPGIQSSDAVLAALTK